MTLDARAQILGALRRSLKADQRSDADRQAVADRLARPERHLRPARIARDAAGLRDLFITMATNAAATLENLPDAAAVPAAVARYLASQNLPAAAIISPALTGLPWSEHAPSLTIRSGAPQDSDPVSVTPVLAGVAETGTLVTSSGPATPSTLNFLPDTHIAILHAVNIVGGYEEIWDRLRATHSDGSWPRTVNMITGPSRTGDIDMVIQLGAHGPRRLHILLVGADD